MAASSDTSRHYPEMDYYLNESLSDIAFVVDGQRLPANKTFLSIKSPVFRAQFGGNFADSNAKEIAISDTTAEGFKAMLYFLHRGRLETKAIAEDIGLAKDIYKLADKYELFRLMHRMDKLFVSMMSMDNFEDICSFAFEYQFKNLMPIAKKFLADNINDWVIKKDIKRLRDLNHNTDDSLFEVIVNRLKRDELKMAPFRGFDLGEPEDRKPNPV